MSSVLPDSVAARLPARAAVTSRLGSVSRLRPGRDAADTEVDVGMELGFRFAAVQVGYRLGWASIVAVLAGLTLGVSVQHRWLLLGSTVAAAVGNAAAMLIPWRDWLATGRGRILLDLWCGGLIAFVALLVVTGGSNFALLLFLVVPFIAVVQVGRRRGLWLAASAGTCALVTASIPLSAGATAMRLALVAAAVTVALVLVRAIRREAARAELARARAQEASHRIKNDLQTAADLLLLGRPDGLEGAAFDVAAERLRSLAVVHRLLTEADDRVDGALLLRSIGAGAPGPIEVEAEALTFDAATAQKLGIVANELLMNAFRHGAPPIRMRLDAGRETRLRVEDGGAGERPAAHTGLGLSLVRRVVEQGLDGRFELRAASTGVGTCAEVVFPSRPL